MFGLFDKDNVCYGIYDKIEYVHSIINICLTIKPNIVFECRKYEINTNEYKVITLKNQNSEKSKMISSQNERIEKWYDKYKSDLIIYEKLKDMDEPVPPNFQEKYDFFQTGENKLQMFGLYIEKFYLKDLNDSSFYKLF